MCPSPIASVSVSELNLQKTQVDKISGEIAKNSDTVNTCVKSHQCTPHHYTTTCQKPRDTPAVCVNCRGAHPANYRGCSQHPNNVNKTKVRKSPEWNKNQKSLLCRESQQKHDIHPTNPTHHS